ncbi:MAG: PAS domain-containing protein [Planctomycetes bacterium]|nr:PAS domain-containing protein [Planctomycetota bacterium]
MDLELESAHRVLRGIWRQGRGHRALPRRRELDPSRRRRALGPGPGRQGLCAQQYH